MPKVTTDVSLRMRTEGAAKVAADTQDLGTKSTQALAAVDAQVKKLEASFKTLTDKQLELVQALEDTADKGSPAYKGLQKDLANVQREATGVERTLNSVRRAYRNQEDEASKARRRRKREEDEERQRRRRSFTQGFLQGMIPQAAYLERGPGMFRQAAGAAIGGRIRAGLGGISQIPFTGAAGLAQAIQALPGGGAFAAPMMTGMQYAQEALQFQQQRQQMLPFLAMGQQVGTRTVGETAQQQRKRIAGIVDQARLEAQAPKQEPTETFIPSGATQLGMMAAVGGIVAYQKAKGAFGGTVGQKLAERRAARDRAKKVEAAGGEAAYLRQQEQAEREADIQAMITVEGGPARQRKRAVTLQDYIQRQGVGMGFALPQAMQLMGGITQAGGGVGRELVTQGLGQAGMAAQRLYGIGPEVTGAFLQAGRAGGAVGAEGRGGAAMVEAIAGGMSLGLEGSELTNWMSQMAQDIRSWQQTGIPINTGSVNALGASFAKWGLGGVRGGEAARGISARARQLSTRGPQGAEELILLQELGGLTGTGVEAFEEAQLKLERGEFSPEELQRAMGRFLRVGGGGAGGRQVFRRAMKRFNVQFGIEETRLLQKQIEGGKLNPEEEAKVKDINEKISQVAKQAPGDIEVMGARARDRTAPALERQARQMNQQLGAGNQMLPIMQDLNAVTRNVVTGFNELAKAPLKDLTGSFKDLSDKVPELGRRLDAMIRGDIAGMVVPYAPGDKT